MDSVYAIATAAFGVGLFSGYLLRKNMFFFRSLAKKQQKSLNQKPVKNKQIDSNNEDFKGQVFDANLVI